MLNWQRLFRLRSVFGVVTVGGLLGCSVDAILPDPAGNATWLTPFLRSADPKSLALGERLALEIQGEPDITRRHQRLQWLVDQARIAQGV